jgi:uncharacterized membrane protein
MNVGPIQVIVFGFERTDKFRGEVVEELANLRGRGLIHLIDLFLAVKSPSGEISATELNDLTEEESVEFGQVIGKLLGVSGLSTDEVTADAVERVLAAASKSVGLDYKGLRHLVENLEPGKAFGVLMFEHTWAIPLRDAIRRAGGVPLAEGFLTQETLVMVGEEVRAIAEAERAIEVSRSVQSAVILDDLATLPDAKAIGTAIAANVLRTLVVADLIEEAAVPEAIKILAAASLLDAEYLDAAVQVDAQEAVEDKQYFLAAE